MQNMFLVSREIEHLVRFFVDFRLAPKKFYKPQLLLVPLYNFLNFAGLNVLQCVLNVLYVGIVDDSGIGNKCAIGINQVNNFQQVECFEMIPFLCKLHDFVDTANHIGRVDIVLCRDVAFGDGEVNLFIAENGVKDGAQGGKWGPSVRRG